MDLVLQSLQLEDHIIKLVIGESENATTFHISQNLLEQTADYFKSAFRNQHLGSSNKRHTLHFPEDDLYAWKIFLYWVMTKELPSSGVVRALRRSDEGGTATYDISLHTLCIRCWILGDKYDVPVFQNYIMLELLNLFERKAPGLHTIKEAFENTPPGSILRELMAEELANMLQVSATAKHSDLDMFDGIVGFASALMKKTQAAGKKGECVFRPRVPSRDGGDVIGASPYSNFMVGKDLIPVHWVYQRGCTMKGGGGRKWE
ncbi:hypothetical protein LTR27_006499 [Elasticomyces elasticus]|nr:hypothetical protein LTR27_006499 [Elasticomyces elasticus]